MTATTNTVILAIADSSVCLSMRFAYIDLITVFLTVVLIPWTETGVVGTPSTLGARQIECPLVTCKTNKDCDAKACGRCELLGLEEGVSLITKARLHRGADSLLHHTQVCTLPISLPTPKPTV